MTPDADTAAPAQGYALRAAQTALLNILQDCPPAEAWQRKAWHPIAEQSLRRLVAYANTALALRAFIAASQSDTPAHRPALWRVLRDAKPGTVELALEPLRFRLYLAPGIEAPATLTPSQVARAEWRYAPPKVRKCPKRGPRKPRPMDSQTFEATA